MKSDDIAIPSIPEIRTISPLSTSRENRVSNSSDSSSDSSPSNLRRRLEDLPSPNEFTLLADRVAALGRRIGRKRELFLRLHGVANRIEENDEWEEGTEQRAELWENSLRAFKSKDARARRRERVRLESSSRCDDKAMVISQTDDPINSSKITDDDKSNPAESSVDRSAREDDRLQLPAIEIPRRQNRSSSLSEPASTRACYSYHNNNESRDIKSAIPAFHSYRNFTPRDSASKSVDLPSVSPFSLNSVKPKKFGGYRPSSGVVLKNLSSGSESESVHDENRGLSSVRKINNSIATLELSSPESKIVAINEPVKKMPIMSARNDIIGSILPNLLPSSRSLDNDNLDYRIPQNTLRSRIVEQINHNDYMKICNEMEKVTRNDVKPVFNERGRCDKLATKTSNELEIEPKYKDMHDERKEMPQNMLTFSARSFVSESAELATSICNERLHHEPILKVYNEFKHVESDFENEHNQKKETESYPPCIAPIIRHDDIRDEFIFNCLTNQSNFKVNSSKNIDENVLDPSESNRVTNFYKQETAETSNLQQTTRLQSNTLEEALSSRPSEPFESESHSRSSCTEKIYLQKEAISSRRSPNNDVETSDNCDQEIITKVPALVLNSQDISYSTSAGSREYSATRPLDPHALIRALSDVSLKQKRQEDNTPRMCENFYWHDKDTIDASNRASDFPSKNETWCVSKSPTLELSKKSLSDVPSRIPIRIYNNKIISIINRQTVNKLSEHYKHTVDLDKNVEETSFIDQIDVRSQVNENIVHQRSNVESSYCQARDSSFSSKNGDIDIKSSIFAPDDEKKKYKVNDHEKIGSVTSLRPRTNPQSTPYGDYTYDKTRYLPETRSGEKSCSPVLFNKAVYSDDRDYAKIDDDDVRSRSDRSMSRKSAGTIDITSATESPFKFKNKKTKSSRAESFRNVEENITWRTEDDCESIDDEGNPEDVKDQDYSAYDEEPKELYLKTKEQFKLAIERTYDPFSPFTIQHSKLNPSEIEKSARKQQAGDDLKFNDDYSCFEPSLEPRKVTESENLTYQIRRKRELSRISSSALNLNCEAKRKKKSQERFPFTISDASAAFSTKHQDTSDYPLSGKNLDYTEKTNDETDKKTVHQLQIHPSITRLTTSGLEDTMADILCCVAQEQKEAEFSKSRRKTFMQIFSKLRRTSKQSNDNKISEPTKIIYENRACQVDSKVNSCSDDSSTEETERINFDKSSNNRCWLDYRRDEKCSSALDSTGNILKKTESLQTIAQKHPYRRYDRDDLWIQDIKNTTFEIEENNSISQEKDEVNNSQKNSPKDPYSIFLVKNLQSDKLSDSNIDHSYFSKSQYNTLISDYVALSDRPQSKQGVNQNIPSMTISEEAEEDLTGCLCWRFCRIIVPFKYRSSVREQVSSSRTKRSDFLPKKRKK